MNYNGLNNSDVVNNTNYREKISEFRFLLDQLTSFMDDMVNNKQNGLPDDIPTTVCGTEGVMRILHCGRSKATDIMNAPQYQSAFFGKKGSRKRLCDTRVLLNLMRQDHE